MEFMIDFVFLFSFEYRDPTNAEQVGPAEWRTTG
jgi:hypothetical protein